MLMQIGRSLPPPLNYQESGQDGTAYVALTGNNLHRTLGD